MTEQQFIEKYYKTKTLKFAPLTFEKFLNTGSDSRTPHWYCGNISIVMTEENNKTGLFHETNRFIVEDDFNYEVYKSFYYTIEDREEIYYTALEYAMNLFLEKI